MSTSTIQIAPWNQASTPPEASTASGGLSVAPWNPQQESAPASPAAPEAKPTISEGGLEIAPWSGSSQASPQSGNAPSFLDDRFTPPEDPDDNWLEKGWHFLNKPLTEDLGLGQYREGAGGFERGAEKILSGLTSPLSLLTMAAFAPVGIGESVAGSVLKEGLADEAAPLLGKALSSTEASAIAGKFGEAVDVAQKAQLAGKPIDTAVEEATGLKPDAYKRMLQFLRDNGFKENDVLPEGAIRRMASQGLAKAGIPAGKALQIAKSAEALTTLGFGLNAVRGATYAYPKMAQLLEEGKVDDAMEYLVEGTADTAFGALGLAGGLTSISHAFPGINEKGNLPLTAESQQYVDLTARRDGILGQAQNNILRDTLALQREKHAAAGVPIPEALKDEGSFLSAVGGHAMNALRRITGGSKADAEKLDSINRDLRIQREFAFHDTQDAIAQGRILAAMSGEGDLEKFNASVKDIEDKGPTLDNLVRRKQGELRTAALFATHSDEQVNNLQSTVSALDLKFQRAKSPEKLKDYENLLQQKRAELQQASVEHQQNLARLNRLKDWANPNDQTLLKYHEQLLQDVQNAKQPVGPEGENALDTFNEKANTLGNAQRDISILRNSKPDLFPKPEEATSQPTGFQPEGAGPQAEGVPLQPWETGPRNSKLPPDIQEMIDQGALRYKKFSKEAQESRSAWIQSFARVARKLDANDPLLGKIADFENNNWAQAHDNGLLGTYLENHTRRDWEDPNVGSVIRAELRSGKFATNVLAARRRYWNTLFEGWSRGKDLKVIDPIDMARIDAMGIAEATANRKTLLDLYKNPRYDLRGMPDFVIPGSGNQVEGTDGEPAKAFIVRPNSIVPTDIPASRIKELEESGLMPELLSTREIVDRTPQVNLASADLWVKGLKEQQEEMEARNPLYLDVKPGNNVHATGYEHIRDFVSQQAAKEADHVRNAIQQVQDAAEDRGGKLLGLNPADMPNDVASNAVLRTLYSGKTLSPKWLEQFEQWAEKREALAQGESASKFWSNPQESAIRPSEIARMLFQSRQFIPQDLMAYLRRTDEKVGTNVAEQWSGRAAGHLIRSIEQAAHADDYVRNQADLGVLNQVKNLYSSVNPITAEQNRPEVEKMLQEINDRQPKKYRYAPKRGDYLEVDHPSFHKWKWMGNTPEGTAVVAESPLLVRKDLKPYLVNRLGLDKSALRSEEGLGKFTGPVLKAGAQAKSLLLSGSPFHIIQEMLRGLMLGINPLIRPNPVADFDTAYNTVRGPKNTMRLAAKNGMTMMSRYYGQEFSEGLASHSGLVSKIPVFGPVSDEIHSFLFDRYIPALKISGFNKMFDKYAQLHPDWTDDAVAHVASEHVNNAFGGQNWREMGRSATTQDWFHIVALAPDWLESEMRFAASVMHGAGAGPLKYQGDNPTLARKQVATMAVGMYMASRVLNMLYSGDPHYEAPFALATKDKEGRTVDFSFRTMPTDLIHAATLPVDFALGRTSPILKTASEVLTGRNQYGQKLSDAEKMVDATSNFIPIPGQGVFKSLTGQALSSDLSAGEQAVKSAGGVGQVYRTPAELESARLASESSEGGPVTPQQIARHRAMLRMEDDLRSGRITNNDVENMIDAGQLSEDEGKQVIKTAKETVGLDPETSVMFSRVGRMAFQNAMDVYNIASPKEKALLQKVILKKAQTYVKSSRTKQTPDQRLKDPYYLQARQLTQAVDETE